VTVNGESKMWFIFLLIVGVFFLILCCGCCFALPFAFIPRSWKDEEEDDITSDIDDTLELLRKTEISSNQVYII